MRILLFSPFQPHPFVLARRRVSDDWAATKTEDDDHDGSSSISAEMRELAKVPVTSPAASFPCSVRANAFNKGDGSKPKRDRGLSIAQWQASGCAHPRSEYLVCAQVAYRRYSIAAAIVGQLPLSAAWAHGEVVAQVSHSQRGYAQTSCESWYDLRRVVQARGSRSRAVPSARIPPPSGSPGPSACAAGRRASTSCDIAPLST